MEHPAGSPTSTVPPDSQYSSMSISSSSSILESHFWKPEAASELYRSDFEGQGRIEIGSIDLEMWIDSTVHDIISYVYEFKVKTVKSNWIGQLWRSRQNSRLAETNFNLQLDCFTFHDCSTSYGLIYYFFVNKTTFKLLKCLHKFLSFVLKLFRCLHKFSIFA